MVAYVTVGQRRDKFSPPAAPPSAPDSWESAVAAATADGSYDPVTAWYAANTGHEALGIEVGDLTAGTLDSAYDGQVFEGITASRIRVGHNDVTIRGCRITGGGTYGAYMNPTFGAPVTGLLVEYCTFAYGPTIGDGDPQPDPVHFSPADTGDGYGAGHFDVTVSHCNSYNWSGAFHGEHRVNFEHNWNHDQQHPPGGHANGIRCSHRGGRAYRNFLTDGSSGLLSIYFDKELTTDIEYRENILVGVSPGASPSYTCNFKNGAYAASAENIQLIGNLFGPEGVQYGYFSDATGLPWGSVGNVRSGNIELLTGDVAISDS